MYNRFPFTSKYIYMCMLAEAKKYFRNDSKETSKNGCLWDWGKEELVSDGMRMTFTCIPSIIILCEFSSLCYFLHKKIKIVM